MMLSKTSWFAGLFLSSAILLGVGCGTNSGQVQDGGTDGTELDGNQSTDEPTGANNWGIPKALDHDLCQPAGSCDGKDAASGDRIPTWHERTFITLVNAARAAPADYRDKYMLFSDDSAANVFDTNPPALQPLIWNHQAAQAARYHATDRTQCTTDEIYAHNLCDDTSFGTWVTWFISNAGFGEVFFEWPFNFNNDLTIGIVNGFICDGMVSTAFGYPASGCVTDNSDRAGHRDLLVLSTSYKELGAGFALTGDRSEWAGVLVASNPTPAIPATVSGSHFFYSGNIVFGLNVYTSSDPQKVAVVIEGAESVLDLDLGSASMGFYSLSQNPEAGCRSYHFLLVDGEGQSWRYPAAGQFQTFLEGDCLEDYI
jgi:hypothetical protein